MARFEFDKNYIVGQRPEGYEDAAQLCVVEADMIEKRAEEVKKKIEK